jgi:[glutamine synthetase] adenylyltransferase / [glutamine synthetase]-adenylyl-L-tyrosine phosphorylase
MPALATQIDAAKTIAMISQGSPYLAGLLRHWPEFAEAAFAQDPAELARKLCASAHDAIALEPEAAARHLRQLKSKFALLTALADISGAWSTSETTRHLTNFADAATHAALGHVLKTFNAKLNLDADDPCNKCGLAVIAMGKHGAHELNYSSDIDLIILFDSISAAVPENVEPQQLYVKITRKLVALLQDLTEDGYMFRVDLRLRPDPRATQVAIDIEAAAIYYENQGQNWERAAMIKARACAGDIALGEEFLVRMKPFIWRKYLDFAAISDVQSLIRQIHAHKGHGEIAVKGHNLKLGRGGIREIEFFVQTQQLIAGGRNPALRGRSTLAMLDQLAEAKWITALVADDLKSAYSTLRHLEHRVQMIEDHQDHCVPSTEDAFAKYAVFAGFENTETLSLALRNTLETVQRHSSALFAKSATLSGQGSLVFTGGEDDPDTIRTLTDMGYANASEVSATIRAWHFGRYAATRSARAREILTELMPELLKALAATGDPPQAFLAFDRFLQGLPSGVQLLSMLKANPHLLSLMANILGSAPRLAQQLSARPRTLEAFLDPAFFGPMLQDQDVVSILASTIPNDSSLEETMDLARELGRELMFRVGVRVLSDTTSSDDAGRSFSAIADGLIQLLHRAVIRDMEQKHGEITGATSAVIAMGKLGGREMTAGSDLDLIVIFNAPDLDAISSGTRPLGVAAYFARLTQRLITALSAPTAEGTLYDVDMRLRPSGSKGPVAVSLASFAEYQRSSAWTWEKLALTRARVVSASAELTEKIETVITVSLCEKREAVATRKDVSDMRALMLKEHAPSSIWDIKRQRGGLVEVEFIVQTLQLLHAAQHAGILNTNTMQALQAVADHQLVSQSNFASLTEATRLYQRLTQMIRLCSNTDFDPFTALPGLRNLIINAAQLPDISTLEATLQNHQAEVARIFDEVIGRGEGEERSKKK